MLLATDGVLDNLFDDEIAQILSQASDGSSGGGDGGGDGSDVGQSAAVSSAAQGGDDVAGDGTVSAPSAAHLAELVARRARDASLEKHRRTPFSVGAAANGLSNEGGKLDDVAVICVKVLPPTEDAADEQAEAVVAASQPRSRL